MDTHLQSTNRIGTHASSWKHSQRTLVFYLSCDVIFHRGSLQFNIETSTYWMSYNIQSVVAKRLTRFLQVTQSYGSLHISFQLSTVHSFTSSNHCLQVPRRGSIDPQSRINALALLMGRYSKCVPAHTRSCVTPLPLVGPTLLFFVYVVTTLMFLRITI